MRSLLHRLLFENAALKAVSLILALTLFILVHGERDAVVAAKIKVVYTMPEDRVLMSDPIEEVRVRIRGSWTRVKRFDEHDVDPIYVDLSEARDGELAFQEDMIRLPPGLKVASINPATIRLEFEKYVTKMVPVTPAFEGEPAHGYQVTGTTATPVSVEVRGARSVVEATAAVETRRVSLDGRTASFSERVALAPTEQHLSVVGAPAIQVDVQISEQPAEMVLRQVPVRVSLPASASGGRRVAQPEAVAVTLRGGRPAIEQVDAKKVTARVEVHADELAGGGPLEVPVVVEGIPTGVAVEVSPRQVTLVRAPGK